MRYVSITFPPTADGRGVHDLVSCVQAERRQAGIFNFDLLADGSLLELVYVEGDREAVVAELDGRDGVRAYEVFAGRGRLLYLYLHVEVDERVRELLSVVRAHRLVVDFPVRFDDAGATLGLVGDPSDLRAALAAFPEPAREELTVDRVHEFAPGARNLRALLTDRQLSVLETAVDLGYYADPRRATVESLADDLDIAQSTASEHLRRIEARVLSALVPGTA